MNSNRYEAYAGTKTENVTGYQVGQVGAEIQRSWNFPGSITRAEASGGRQVSDALYIRTEQSGLPPEKILSVTDVLRKCILFDDPQYSAAVTDNKPRCVPLQTRCILSQSSQLLSGKKSRPMKSLL